MASENADTTTADSSYELIYYPGLPGRGEFVRLLFEESGVSFIDTSKTSEAVSTTLAKCAPDYFGDDKGNLPMFAPPMLRHGDILINQTPNMLLYLAPRLGLAPAEGTAGIYHLNSIVLTLIDGFVNELHDTHHPIAVTAYYKDQMPEAKKRAKSYTEERIPKFLAYIQRVLNSKASGDGPWLYGGRLTYADLVLFQCIHGTEYAFPKAFGEMRASGKYDDVFTLYNAVKERPNIKAYMASERRMAYGEGIWRHYPELEEN